MGKLVEKDSMIFEPFLNEYFDVDDFFKRNVTDQESQNFPAVNILEDEAAFIIDMAVPGFEKEAFSIKVDHDVLTISANKEESSEAAEKNYTRKEYQHESFSRSFRLPDNVNDDRIQASYKKGVLHVTLPKNEVVKKQTQEIKIN